MTDLVSRYSDLVSLFTCKGPERGAKALQFLLEGVSLPGFPEEANKGFEKSHPAQPSPDLPQATMTLLGLLLAPPQSRLALITLSFQDLPARAHLWGRVISGGSGVWGPSPLVSEF